MDNAMERLQSLNMDSRRQLKTHNRASWCGALPPLLLAPLKRKALVKTAYHLTRTRLPSIQDVCTLQRAHRRLQSPQPQTASPAAAWQMALKHLVPPQQAHGQIHPAGRNLYLHAALFNAKLLILLDSSLMLYSLHTSVFLLAQSGFFYCFLSWSFFMWPFQVSTVDRRSYGPPGPTSLQCILLSNKIIIKMYILRFYFSVPGATYFVDLSVPGERLILCGSSWGFFHFILSPLSVRLLQSTVFL